jgi:hypothetical protein
MTDRVLADIVANVYPIAMGASDDHPSLTRI